MRRRVLTIAVAIAALTGAAVTSVGAQEPPASTTSVPDATVCDGDTVTAAINTQSLPNGGWSVTDACLPAGDFFTGMYEEAFPFAIGLSVVTYDDGHTGRLAFLSVGLTDEDTLTVLGMEDPVTGAFRFAGSIETAQITDTGASVTGQGLAVPPLELATVRLDFRDTAAPWPEWATTTTVPGASTTTVAAPSTLPPSTTASTTIAGP